MAITGASSHGMNPLENGESSDEWGAIEIGEEIEDGGNITDSGSSESDSESSGHKKKKSKKDKKAEVVIKNDPEEVKKAKAKVEALTTKLHRALLKVKRVLKKDHGKQNEVIKDKLKGADDKISAAEEYFEKLMAQNEKELRCQYG